MKFRLAGFAGSFAEQDVVIQVGIERRVEIIELEAGVGRFIEVRSQPRLSPKKSRFMRRLFTKVSCCVLARFRGTRDLDRDDLDDA